MFHMLIDTYVWLDLAENLKQTPLLAVVKEPCRVRLRTIEILLRKRTLRKSQACRNRRLHHLPLHAPAAELSGR